MGREAMKSVVLLGAATALLVATTMAAPAVEPVDQQTMRSIIDQQIEAFRADDGSRAYAIASPTVRMMFGSPDAFMVMVRQGYQPVYRPKSYLFGPARDGDSGPELSVLIEDQAGSSWTAVYSFEKQPDGSWAVSGCRLVKTPEQSA